MTHQSPDLLVSFVDHKHSLVNQALKYVAESRSNCVEKVASSAARFIEDGSTIMVHGYSRVVLHTLLRAYSPSEKPRKRFQVFVTESRPSGLGLKTHAILEQFGIPCVVVLDSAVAYAMAKVDLVLVGAEAVLEDGGLINYIGCYQMAIAAKAHHKPFYALTERYGHSVLIAAQMGLHNRSVPYPEKKMMLMCLVCPKQQLQISATIPALPIRCTDETTDPAIPE
ncbi:translation initiation factor eIF-2B subunit alpha, variant 2 [Puccinia graminis f. sp. tritici]|nr:translation initiation factor eIF-2B subunit alpha, variant 2 [Puccinia graminis f. sp. tritici]